MSILSNTRLLVVLAIGLLATLGAVAYAATAAREDGAETAGTAEEVVGSGQEDDATEEVSYASVRRSIDPKDERQIVGSATDVFFGRVVEISGSEGAPTSKPGTESPQTQYAVEVTQIIKGDASGTVTVNQKGGYVDDGHADHKHLELAEGDELLEPGREYLFATNYVGEDDWYGIITSGGFANVEVKDGAQRQELKDRFEKGKANEMAAQPKSKEKARRQAEDPYRPCRPDGSTPPSWKEPCDPSDPIPSALPDPKSAPSKDKGTPPSKDKGSSSKKMQTSEDPQDTNK